MENYSNFSVNKNGTDWVSENLTFFPLNLLSFQNSNRLILHFNLTLSFSLTLFLIKHQYILQSFPPPLFWYVIN